MSVPEFPEFVSLGLEHKPEVDEAFARIKPTISEFTFTNLFIWRFYYNISVSKMQDHLLFLARPSGKQPFFYPPWGEGDTGLVIKRCLQFLAEIHAGHARLGILTVRDRRSRPPQTAALRRARCLTGAH